MPSSVKGIVVRLPEEARQRLNSLAQSRDRSLNFVINEAVRRYLDEEAWLIDHIRDAVQEADAADAVFVSHAEVIAGLDATIEQARQRHIS
jgi:predicted transcriptional regulator